MARTIKHGDTWFIDDENYDYSTEIQKAVDAGDYQKAAYLEKSRNAKIDRFAMPYDKTYTYQDFLPGKYDNPPAVPAFEKGSNADKANRTLSRAQAMNFHYDANKDPLYKQIKKNYQNTANDVIENTMGSYAGMTGGMPSSFATSAAAQAGAQHLQKADDMIPELYQLAYNKFSDDKADLYKQYGIYQGLEEQQRAAEVADREWNRIVENDQWNKDIYTAETEKADAKEAQENASTQIANALLLGRAPSDELIAASGAYDPGTTGQMLLDAFQKDENKQNAAERVSNAFLMGVPPKEEDLALLNYPEGITGEAALAAYKAANAPKVTYSGGSSGSKTLKKPTASMFEAIDKLFSEDGEGIDGYEKLKSRYDWRTYDESAYDSYVQNYYGDIEGVDGYFESTYEGTVPKTASDYAKGIADEVNRLYMADSEESGYEPISKNSNGTYSISGSAVNRVLDMIANNDNISQETAAEIISMFGITQKQLEDYVNNRNY